MDATDAVNYGAIGVVIGHEISHGFDDQGAQYDAQGRLSNWWTADDLKKFQERGQCVVDQFDGYFIEPGIHHNGKLVLGESIGDLAGAKIAYRAFQKSRSGARPAPDRSTASRPSSSSSSPGASSAATRSVPRRSAHDGAGRPAPDRQVPRDRPALEPAGVRAGVLVQAGRADGAASAPERCEVW